MLADMAVGELGVLVAGFGLMGGLVGVAVEPTLERQW
jgi:hypothetical protein